MNGQDPEVEPPRWSELGYGLYHWAIFACFVAVIAIPVLAGAAIRHFFFY
jgi:hypothetical protein